MPQDALPPLFRPFETGDLGWPAASDKILLLGATADLYIPSEFLPKPIMAQGFRPDFLTLGRRGANISPQIEGDGYDIALVMVSRHRGESEMRIAEAIDRSKADGVIVVAGGKSDGVSSLRKRLADLLPLEGHLAKNHGEVLWFQKSSKAIAYANDIRATLKALPLVDGRFQTAPGMFSHDRVDAGSRLLVDALPDNLAGLAADFCAGWGYFSVSLVERNPAIAGVDLYEADYASLQAAQQNMATLAPGKPCTAHWLDLTAEKVDKRYDVIVMNPPFHRDRAADPGIGQAMIRAAARALKSGGQLFMVANRGLPYETVLKPLFGGITELAADKTFKVWRARR